MTSWTSTVWLSFLHDGSWRYQLFFWQWQVAGVIRLATRQSRRCKNHQLKLKLAKPQIRRRKASRSMLFIIIFKFGYSNYTTRRCFYQNRWLFFLSLSDCQLDDELGWIFVCDCLILIIPCFKQNPILNLLQTVIRIIHSLSVSIN